MGVRNRILQLKLLMRWKTPRFRPYSESDCAIIRHYIPSLWHVCEYRAETKEIGRFLSLLNKYSTLLAVFQGQKPTEVEIRMLCGDCNSTQLHGVQAWR
jgi:hypothetical protein